MEAATISEIVQMGGVLTFATVVYFQLKEQTRIFREIGDTLVRIAERQSVLLDRQSEIAAAIDYQMERVGARR